MTKKIILTIIISIIGLFAFSLYPSPSDTYAYDVCNSSGAPKEVREAAGCNGNKDALPNAVQTILNSIIFASGTIAVVFIVIGGINYITSNGDSGKIEKAKKTILYACIGLAVTALAFAIVNWVVSIIPKS